uniref:hypothetical protein n=1 Tax=Prevotella sp. TaxID=59823 RepID=UPI004025B4F0
ENIPSKSFCEFREICGRIYAPKQSVGGTLLAAEARIPPLLKRETAQQLLLNSCWAAHIEVSVMRGDAASA